MRIKYVASRGISPMLLHGVVGPSGVWYAGEIRDFGPNDEISVRPDRGAAIVVNAIDFIFSHGVEFVNPDTNKNPQFQCATCGEVTTDLGFIDKATLESPYVEYRNGDRKRQCIKDWLADNPRYISQHARTVYDRDVVEQAKTIVGAREAKVTQDAERASAIGSPTPAPSLPVRVPATAGADQE